MRGFKGRGCATYFNRRSVDPSMTLARPRLQSFALRTSIRQKLHDGDPRSSRDDHGPPARRRCLTLVVAFAASAPARAEPVSAADARAAKAIVSAQLDAFASDDAKRAFSYAAPAIRSMFDTPERFLAMVRAGYPVVYRPAAVTFLLPLRVEGELRPGRPPDRRGRRALARDLPPRAPARRRLANRRLRRAAGDRQDGLAGPGDARRLLGINGASRGACDRELSRGRHRQHAPEVGALRRPFPARRC